MRKRLCKHSLHPLGLAFIVFANSLKNNQIELNFTGIIAPKASKKINSTRKKSRENVYFYWTTPSKITYGTLTLNLIAGLKVKFVLMFNISNIEALFKYVRV